MLRQSHDRNKSYNRCHHISQVSTGAEADLGHDLCTKYSVSVPFSLFRHLTKKIAPSPILLQYVPGRNIVQVCTCI